MRGFFQLMAVSRLANTHGMPSSRDLFKEGAQAAEASKITTTIPLSVCVHISEQ